MKRYYLIMIVVLLNVVMPAIAQEITETRMVSQRFAGGEMIYNQDSGDVFILLAEESEWQRFPSLQYGWLPENANAAPEGYYAPVRGFGRIWANYDDLHEKLGWAVLPEIGFTARFSQQSGTYYIERLDRQIYRLNPDRTWDYLSRNQDIPPVAFNSTAREASVDRLVVSPLTVAPGGVLTIEWAVSGSEHAAISIWELAEDGSRTKSPSPMLHALPISGTLNWGIPEFVRGRIEIVVSATTLDHFPSSLSLWVYLAQSTRIVTLEEGNWSVETLVVYQPFENGFMIWRADTGDVRVFRQNGVWALFPEAYYGNIPQNDLSQILDCDRYPVNAFAIIWGTVGLNAQDLGCPLAEEIVYQTVIEVRESGTVYKLPDGRSIVLKGNSWSE